MPTIQKVKRPRAMTTSIRLKALCLNFICSFLGTSSECGR
jgi:hypothetical protein